MGMTVDYYRCNYWNDCRCRTASAAAGYSNRRRHRHFAKKVSHEMDRRKQTKINGRFNADYPFAV